MSTLVFVYNADSGLFNTLTDIAHKMLSPRTYNCNLCAITHSPLGMRQEWKLFVDSLGMPLEFLHRGEFTSAYAGLGDIALPAILRKESDDQVEVLVNADAINAATTIEELQALIRSRLAAESSAEGRPTE